jgi:hypothetical protein
MHAHTYIERHSHSCITMYIYDEQHLHSNITMYIYDDVTVTQTGTAECPMEGIPFATAGKQLVSTPEDDEQPHFDQ